MLLLTKKNVKPTFFVNNQQQSLSLRCQPIFGDCLSQVLEPERHLEAPMGQTMRLPVRGGQVLGPVGVAGQETEMSGGNNTRQPRNQEKTKPAAPDHCTLPAPFSLSLSVRL